VPAYSEHPAFTRVPGRDLGNLLEMENAMTQDALGSPQPPRRGAVPFLRLFATLALFTGTVGTASAQRLCPPGDDPGYVDADTVAMALQAPAATLVPDDVCLPRHQPLPERIPLAYFDDHAWRSFIAVVWPALDGERGVPDPRGVIETAAPRDTIPDGPSVVFETYKADWETFRFDGQKPAQWKDWQRDNWSSAQLQCIPDRDAVARPKAYDFFLMPSAADYRPVEPNPHYGLFDNVVKFTGKPGTVLVAQNGSLVRYLAAYNEIEFNQILVRKWYLLDELPPKKDAVEFLDGSMSVKSAWIDMGRLDESGTHLVSGYTVAYPETFHRRKAWLYDPFTGHCAQHVVGLVGLHIVHKTPTQHEWIWASFEHVNNVPDRSSLATLPPGSTGSRCASAPSNPSYYTFNDGSLTSMQGQPPDYSIDSILSHGCAPPPAAGGASAAAGNAGSGIP
jgi:hypothetical protein